MNNTIMSAKNTFSEGLVMDFSPDNTSSNTLTSALNATLLTSNGNEMALQNDMGNGRVETAYLPEGYVPVGTCEFGDIIYVVSYNPLTNKSQIGCFPSPERNIDSNEVGEISNIIKSDAFNDNKGNIKSTKIKVELTSTKLSPGDKYIIYGTELNNNLSYYGDVTHSFSPEYTGLVTLHIASIDDDNRITYLDSSLKWDNDYYIKSGVADSNTFNDIDQYRNLVSSPYNIFSSKTSGKLCIVAELVTIDSFSCTWDAEVESGSNDQKVAKILFYTNWQSQNSKINPSYAIIKINDSDSYYSEYSNLPDRNNDGNDQDEILESVEYSYNASDDLSNTYIYYSIIPAMKVGQLPWLETKGSINLKDIGSGKIELSMWRYYVNSDSILLSWGLDAYPEKNKRISQITMKFIPHTGEESNIAIYTIPEKISYSGYFTESIPFESSNYKLQGNLHSNNLYLVEISIEYGNDSQKTNLYFYRWVYTNSMWNDKYLENKQDFNDLQPELEFSSNTKVEQFLSSKQTIVTSKIGTDSSQDLKDTLSYNKYEILNESNNIKVSIKADFKNNYNIFSIDNQYVSFTNTLGKSSITTSTISYISEGTIQSETQLLDPILDTLQEGQNYLSKRGEENEELIDTFDIVEGNNFSNSNTFYLTCHGVTYNKVTYYDKFLTLTYSSIVAPIIYDQQTLLNNNISYESLNNQEGIKFIFNKYLYFGPSKVIANVAGAMIDYGEVVFSGNTIQRNSSQYHCTEYTTSWGEISWLQSDFQQLIKNQVEDSNIQGSIIPFIFARHSTSVYFSKMTRSSSSSPSIGTWLFSPTYPINTDLVSEQFPNSIKEPQKINENFIGGLFIKGTNEDTFYPTNFFYSFSNKGGQNLLRTGDHFKGKTAADAIVDILGQCYVVHDKEASKNLYIPGQLNYLDSYTEYWNKEIITDVELSKDNYSQIQINSIKLKDIISNISKYVTQSSKIDINNISPNIKSSSIVNNIIIPIQNKNDQLIVQLKNFETMQGSLVYTNDGNIYIDNSTLFNKGKVYFRNIEDNIFTSIPTTYLVTKRELTQDDRIKFSFDKSYNQGEGIDILNYFQYNRLTQRFEVIPSNYVTSSNYIEIKESHGADWQIKDLSPKCYLNNDFQLLH